jgi:hypothetical protein
VSIKTRKAFKDSKTGKREGKEGEDKNKKGNVTI